MRAAKVQASLCIRAVSPEPSLLAHTSSESRGTFRQKARSLAPLNGRACAVEICHDGMLEDKFACRGSINGEVSWLPTKECHRFNRLRYWNQLINRDDSRHCKKVFLWDYSICGDNWRAEIKDVLSEISNTRSFENKEICNLNNVRVKHIPKLRTYATYEYNLHHIVLKDTLH